MKAYYVYLDYGCDRWSVVVFAESAGQAKMEAIRSGYLGDYVEYLALRGENIRLQTGDAWFANTAVVFRERITELANIAERY